MLECSVAVRPWQGTRSNVHVRQQQCAAHRRVHVGPGTPVTKATCTSFGEKRADLMSRGLKSRGRLRVGAALSTTLQEGSLCLLQQRLALRDTWRHFTVVAAGEETAATSFGEVSTSQYTPVAATVHLSPLMEDMDG